ncbi:hypothetical protein M9H77_26107 [Catharanthus roseus]|uniref:Uncharacterized protein n=1 Tax=Catharanthus roseus TaxID=4058 RepID=A0ACC0AAV0_CATRO|nr:hypothetical protein M9H77_26107 [Catharanthus roseus]
MTMRVPTYYEAHRMFYFNLYSMNNDEEMHAVNNDDDEVDRSDGDDAVSSQSELDNDNEPEEGEFQTPINPVNPVNPVTENTVQQWESNQWFSNARYDYTQSGAFLDFDSGSSVDDTIESGTVRLLDWNDSMTEIQ